MLQYRGCPLLPGAPQNAGPLFPLLGHLLSGLLCYLSPCLQQQHLTGVFPGYYCLELWLSQNHCSPGFQCLVRWSSPLRGYHLAVSGLLVFWHHGEGTSGTLSVAGFLLQGHPALALFPVEIEDSALA